MCGRFTLKTPAATIRRQMNLFAMRAEDSILSRLVPRYNIAPTDTIVVLRTTVPKDGPLNTRQTVAPKLHEMQWGVLAKSNNLIINTRLETITEKKSLPTDGLSCRCVVLADGYYEWKQKGNDKIPYYFYHRDQRVFGMAGLWRIALDRAKKDAIECCTIITMPANESVGKIHERMPALLDTESALRWLDPDLKIDSLGQLLMSVPTQWLHRHTVHSRINRVGIDHPQCIAPVSYDRQTPLF